VEHFVTLERAIACPQASAAVAAETAAQVLTSAGYRRGLGFGPTASYVRTYRPLWLVVVARVGAVFTLGLTLLLLRYHKKDHCNVVIEDGPYGVVALVSGRVPATLPTALEAASGQYVQPLEPDGSYQEPPPMLLTPPAGQENSPSHTPQAILRPATPVPPMNQAPGSPVGEQLASGADGGYAASPRLLSDPYPMPQHEPAPGGVPGWARLPERMPGSAPSSAEVVPPAGPVRPPSRLAPRPGAASATALCPGGTEQLAVVRASRGRSVLVHVRPGAVGGWWTPGVAVVPARSAAALARATVPSWSGTGVPGQPASGVPAGRARARAAVALPASRRPSPRSRRSPVRPRRPRRSWRCPPAGAGGDRRLRRGARAARRHRRGARAGSVLPARS
jgi:hypothetical protein